MTTASARLAGFTVGLECGDIPAKTITAAKLHLLDTLGCGLAAHALGVGTAGQAVASVAAAGGVTVIGRAAPAPARDGALANGMLCHGLDFDDTHGESICHVSVVTVPATVAMAEAQGSSGGDLLAALVAGNEIVTRIGAVAAPGYMTRGFHPTSVCGVFGAAASAARLLGLNEREAVSALGIAGSMAAGIFAYLGDGSATKPVHAGWAASGGVTAAQLAAAGGEGPATVFEDRFGFFAAYYERRDEALADRLSDLGDRWETPRIAFKPYPACHFIHACLDAAATLVEARPIETLDVRRIVVAVPEPAIPLVLEPAEAKADPRTEYDAKFSLPYSIAALLLHGRVDVASYTQDAIRDPDVLALAARVEYEPRSFSTYPRAFPGWVRIESDTGEIREEEIPYQRGGPENPMTEEEVVGKFRRNAALAVDPDVAARLEEAVLSLETIDDVGTCFGGLAATASAPARV